MTVWDASCVIHEEAPDVVEEVPAVVGEESAVEDVYGDGPPVDEYRLSSRPRIVSGGS